jgi:3-hydroxyisobutyrate dehydrogenase-like beta-hydroxyacid dehydrogenase
MGSALANHLVTHGYQTYGYDPDERSSKEAHIIGVKTQLNATAVAQCSDLILLSLPNEEALNSTVTQILNDPKVAALKPIIADLSTLSIDCKVHNHDRLAKAGIEFFDCPISGTGMQAKTGDIAIYASGSANSFNSLTSVFDCFARSVFYIGEFGQGTKMKIAANLLVAVHNVATAEALSLALASGLDADIFCEVIASGAGSSRIFELRSPLMAKGTYLPPTMKLNIWSKDMEIIKQFSDELGVPTPLFSATSPIYEAAMAQGRGEQDTAAVFTVLQDMVKQKQTHKNKG